jgi:hypothetical protein
MTPSNPARDELLRRKSHLDWLRRQLKRVKDTPERKLWNQRIHLAQERVKSAITLTKSMQDVAEEEIMKVENYRSICKGHLIGVFDAVIPEYGMRIIGCSVFDGQSGKFIRLPQQKNVVGTQTQYTDVISMDRVKKQQFDQECLRELSEHLPRQMPDGLATQMK